MLRKFLIFTRQRIRRFTCKATASAADTSAEQLLRSTTSSSPNQPPDPEPASTPASPTKSRRPRRRKAKNRPESEPNWSLDQFQVPPMEGKTRFHDFDLQLSLMQGIAELGFQYCTPIQEKALPTALAGSDLIGKANTGTGKSAVFLIATMARLLKQQATPSSSGHPRALVIAPTRELVIQIAKDGAAIGRHTGLSIVAVYGGADYTRQIETLKRQPADIVVATPGRLLDFCGKNIVRLSNCEVLVIDEADRMLDMGFIPDVRRIIGRMPDKEQRQTMLFSATITGDVQRLAAQWCTKPTLAEIEEEEVSAETVEQIVYMVTEEEKYNVLYNLLQQKPDDRILVFTNQKHEARRLNDRLIRNGINSALLTGDVPQAKRTSRLETFRTGRIKVLVATDVAGRGIHIDDITHVVNYTLPYEPEDYVHRIGRTGRAGASGVAISFACEQGGFYMPAIEEFIGRSLECDVPDDSLLVPAPKGTAPTGARQDGGNRRRPRRRRPSGTSNRGR
jgi:ATP-dependent RNA helicase RhlB